MSVLNFFTGVDPAVIGAYIAGFVIPAVGAVVHRQRWGGFVYGLITVVLAFLNGVFSTIAAEPKGMSWPLALSTALGSYIVATIAHSKLYAGTNVEAALLSIGNRSAPATPAAPAPTQPPAAA